MAAVRESMRRFASSMAAFFSFSFTSHQQSIFSFSSVSSLSVFWSSACMSFNKLTTLVTGRSLRSRLAASDDRSVADA